MHNFPKKVTRCIFLFLLLVVVWLLFLFGLTILILLLVMAAASGFVCVRALFGLFGGTCATACAITVGRSYTALLLLATFGFLATTFLLLCGFGAVRIQ